MGLFDKLKNLITRKKEVVEEVKDKYEVENVEDIEEENIEEEVEENKED